MGGRVNRAEAREYAREYKEAALAKGRCPLCVNPLAPGKKTCEAHVEAARQYKRSKRMKGLCNFCTEPVEPGKSSCAKHHEASYQRNRALAEAAALAGRCAWNGCLAPAEHGKKQCAEHLAKLRAYGKGRVIEGVCRRCPAPTTPGRTVCDNCAKRSTAWAAEKRRERKERGVCTACGRNPLGAGLVCLGCWFANSATANVNDRLRGPEIRALFDAQGGRCALTGDELTPGVNASLDHIVPRAKGGGNEITNLRWVTFAVNRAKQDMSDDDLFVLCAKVIEARARGGFST